MKRLITKKSKPVAYCTRCRAYSRNEGQINQKCHVIRQGNRCQGMMRSALKPDDWVECPSCGATGRVKNGTCDKCAGEGWILTIRI
jgi:DnaJ-class molecular chaperone